MFLSFFYTILIIIGALFLLSLIYGLFFLSKLRRKMRSLVKSYDHSPAEPRPKQIQVVESKTINKK